MLDLLTILLGNFDHSLFKSIYIFLISFFSNTFSAISGGGAGLLQLPALILSGVPYYQALASHKLATVALGIGGSLRNYKSLGNDITVAWQILIFGLPGVIFGASVVEYISEKYLYLTLGIISILLAFYSFLKPDLGLSSGNKKLNFVHKIRFLIFIFLIGILNGSISSGTGLLVTILLVKTFEMDFLRAISMTFFTVGVFLADRKFNLDVIIKNPRFYAIIFSSIVLFYEIDISSKNPLHSQSRYEQYELTI